MTAEQNKTVIRQFFDAWNARRPEAFADLMTPDVVRHCDATPAVEARSLDQIKQFLAQDTAVFPDSRANHQASGRRGRSRRRLGYL